MTPEAPREGPGPPELEVRDWMFSRQGAVPTARLTHRFAAFLFDVILLTAFSLLILTRWLIPQFFPSEFQEFNRWSQTYWEQNLDRQQRGEPVEPVGVEDIDEGIWRMLFFAQNFTVMLFWLYFGAADTFFSGRSLGKRMFRLKVVDFATLGPLGFGPALIRSCIKTLCFFTVFPLLLVIYALVFFNRFRRSGHDLITRSIVVEDNTPGIPTPPASESLG